MKIIHIADIHLASKFEHYSISKAKQRNIELLMTFQSVFEFARKHKINIILIAGDLFDEMPSASFKKEVEALFHYYHEIHIFYLRGNHDPLIHFDEENVHPFSAEFTSYLIDQVCIGGIEDPSSIHTINFQENTHNILLYHGALLHHLRYKHIDYVALGHYHRFETGTIDARGCYAYPGCLEARGYDEIGKKGMIVYDSDDHPIKRYELFKRDVVKAVIDLSNLNTTSEAILKIKESLVDYDQNNLLLIELTGKLNVDHTISLNDLHNYIEQNYEFYDIRINDKITLVIDIEKYRYDHSLKGKFISMVMDSEEENKEEIIHYGLLALEKGDLGE